MDEERRSPHEDPRAAAPGEPPQPPPPPGPFLPPPPSAVGYVPPAVPGWLPPPEAFGRPRLEIGSVLGRTLDTFGREWSLFLVLAAPAAFAAVLQVLVIPAFDPALGAAAYRARSIADPGLLLVVSVIAVTLGGLTSLASAIAADRLWRGVPTGPSDAFAGVARCLRRAVPVWLLLLTLQVLLAAPGLLVVPLDAAGRPTAEFMRALPLFLLVGLPLGIVGVVASVVIQARLSLLTPVVALEEGPARGVIPRTWRLTRGYAIVLFATSLIVALCAAVTAWGASLFLVFGQNRVIAGVALALSALVTAPLSGIWTAIAWGDLTGGRHADSALMARGRGRLTTAALLVGLGGILLFVGIGVAGASMERFLGR